MGHFRSKEFRLALAGSIIVVALAVVLPLITMRNYPLPDRFALARLALQAAAFPAIFLALYFNLVQLRKSMARPRIKVAFNEKGEQHVTLICKNGQLTAGLPLLWLINKGNAVARYFQIDFIVPENIGKQSRHVASIKNERNYVLPYTNDGGYTLFVNNPYSPGNIHFSTVIDTKKCINVDSFEIEYRIYGDWAETQEGKLKVNIIKQ